MKDTLPQAVQAAHKLLLWLIPQIDKFPRVRRFTLGERLGNVMLEVMELSREAAYHHARGRLGVSGWTHGRAFG